ncbi:hypothetical protein [Actinomyces vulturis]|uniref:hypothetical protein n=1 Tax=Actinomyces vulturis TaxID=1857645 RepID=UPI0008354E0B|nr:hypothetical protein [Actinomyces vulturis]
MLKRLEKIVLGIIISVGLLGLMIAPASANINHAQAAQVMFLPMDEVDPYDDPGAPDPALSTSTNPCIGSTAASTSNLLPINRWGDSVDSFHSRLDAKSTSDVSEKVSRNSVQSNIMGFGNSMWRIGSSALFASGRFCPMDSMGHPIDSFVGSLGEIFSSSGLIAILMAWTIISALLDMRRGMLAAAVVKSVFSRIVVLAFIMLMISGAGASTDTTPGRFSPWWWVTKTNAVVDASASFTTTMLTTAGGDPNSSGYVNVYDGKALFDTEVMCSGDEAHTGYIEFLHGKYTTAFGATKTSATMPLTLSKLWEGSALPAWVTEQFGSDNPYADKIFCFYPEAGEMGNSVSRNYFAQFLGQSTGGEYSSDFIVGCTKKADGSECSTKPTNAMKMDDTQTTDRALVGWAACVPTGPENALARTTQWSDIGISDDDCKAWWTGGEIGSSTLEWKDDADKVKERAGQYPAAYNYVTSLHGKGNSSSMATTIFFAIGSLIIMAVFVLLAAIQAGTKLILVFCILSLFVAGMKALAPGSHIEPIKKVSIQIVGASFLASGAGMILSFVMSVTMLISKLGVATFGPGEIGSLLFTSVGPLIAVYMLHKIFKTLGAPSPFSPSGMKSWGGAALRGGLIGAAGAGAVNALDNLRSRRSDLKEGIEKAQNSTPSTAPGGGRIGGEKPRSATEELQNTGFADNNSVDDIGSESEEEVGKFGVLKQRAVKAVAGSKVGQAASGAGLKAREVYGKVRAVPEIDRAIGGLNKARNSAAAHKVGAMAAAGAGAVAASRVGQGVASAAGRVSAAGASAAGRIGAAGVAGAAKVQSAKAYAGAKVASAMATPAGRAVAITGKTAALGAKIGLGATTLTARTGMYVGKQAARPLSAAKQLGDMAFKSDKAWERQKKSIIEANKPVQTGPRINPVPVGGISIEEATRKFGPMSDFAPPVSDLVASEPDFPADVHPDGAEIETGALPTVFDSVPENVEDIDSVMPENAASVDYLPPMEEPVDYDIGGFDVEPVSTEPDDALARNILNNYRQSYENSQAQQVINQMEPPVESYMPDPDIVPETPAYLADLPLPNEEQWFD